MLIIQLLAFILFLLIGCAEQPSREATSIEPPAPVPVKPALSPVKPKIAPVSKQKESYHIVQKNETLYSIGVQSGYGYALIAKWNNIGGDHKIRVGQKLKLFKESSPPADTILIKAPKAVPKEISSSPKKSIISNNREKVLKLYWQWPTHGKILKNFAQTGKKGIDIEAGLGGPILAAANGEVVYSGSGLIGYGQLLIIKHSKVFLSAYANNEVSLVNEGQVVAQGQEIARCGKGRSGKPSLHFEIRKNGKPVNPLLFLPAQ